MTAPAERLRGNGPGGSLGGAPSQTSQTSKTPPRRKRRLLPRGLRARLTATYTLAAALLTLAGAAVFLFVLTISLRANLDSDVASRAQTLVNVLADSTSRPVEPPAVGRVPLHSSEPVTFDAP